MSEIKTVTLGCRFNFYESEVAKAMIQKIGPNEDVIIINTCSVTHEAERQSKQTVRKNIRENPGTKIIVTGCAAKTAYEYFSNLAGVSQVIQNDQKDDINSYAYLSKTSEKQSFDETFVEEKSDELFRGKARVFLQIQNGCDNYCSFCIVPFTRGRSKSLPLDLILKRVEHFVSIGFKEIVFSGIDITSYGRDLESLEFADVLETVLRRFSDLQRIRISSIDPKGVSEKLFNIIATEKRIMPHLHLSIQAGDNDVLKMMKRRHTREDVLSLCSRLKEKRPDIVYGADFIVGFPGESENMFKNTLKLVDEASISLLHVFPYSPRIGTLAATFLQQPNSIVYARGKNLREKASEAKKKLFKSLIGKKVTIIVEKVDSDFVFGKTDNFLPIKCFNNPIGSLVGEVIENRFIQTFDEDFLIAE